MTNFYITNDYKLKKIYGYKTFFDFDSPIRGMYTTNLGGTEYLLVAAGGKLYYFLKEDLEDTWEELNPHPEALMLTESPQIISTIQLDYGEIRTYAHIVSQDRERNETTYSVKATLYVDGGSVTLNYYSLTLDGSQTSFPYPWSYSGETTLREVEQTITHNPDGSSVVRNIKTIWDSSLGGGQENIDVQFPTLSPNPPTGVYPTEIGTIPDVETSFFTFDKKIYILCGKYMSWDGTTLSEIEGYTPLVFINTPPSGGGLVYEEINLLSPKKHQTFNGDGTSTDYYIAQKNITSIDKVIVNGTEKTITTDYTIDLTAGKVVFVTAPAQGMDNVDIYWTLDDGDRDIIEGMKFGTVFGGDVDTRVFLYGNPSCQNRTYYSGLNEVGGIGVPSVEYFPSSNFVDVGPSNFALTDLTRQYDRLLATTNRPEAYYMTIGIEKLEVTLITNATTTRYVSSVSTFPLNEVHGNFADGQGQLIDNNPVTFDKNALIMWKSTNVRDERNMEDISQKIRLDLVDIDATMIKSLDHQSDNQLWFGVGNKIYIYNYFNKTYSRLYIPDELRHFADLGNSVYMGTNDGKVMKWGEQFDGFDDEIIDAYWEMNFEDFDTAYLRKTMNRLWVLMQPQAKSSADIGFITNRSSSSSKKHIEYSIQVMDNVDFAGYTFEISNNPQPFRLKMKAKKFTNLKIVIENKEKTDCTILQLVLKVESFGESK